MSKVTEKNTKKEIMEYVKELELKLAEKADSRKTTEDVKRENKVKEIKESAAKLVATGIVNEKTEAQYNNLLETIKLLDKELEEVYEIQRTANTLEALLITYQDKSEALEKEYQQKLDDAVENYNNKRDEWDAKIAEAQADYNKLIKDLKASYAEERAALDKERAREKEEYAYNLNRERSIENDKWADEKAVREKVLSEKEENLAIREKELDELYKKVAKLESTVEDLEVKKVLEYNKGFEEGKAKAKKEAETSKGFSDRAHKAELERKDDVIASLEKSNAELRQEKNILQAKLDEAYARIQSMAIESAKNSGIRMVESTNK